ncbi:MAG: hypothetical protein OQK82_00555, partial [Candidatus Pacearchaeota archaeon]|nr:hypothetical protein [Candidatus Pacearchaeota archaeon]
MSGDITLSAVDLVKFRKVEQSLNDLTKVLHLEKQEIIAKARSYAQSYTNIFGESYPPSYIDLGHFAKLLVRESKNKKITTACDTLITAIKNSVIAEKHGSSKPGSMGISIYFPNSELYKADWGGMESYAYAVPEFVKTSGWDDFLLSHYTGKATIEDEVAIPEKDDIIIAPGKGEITISEISLSKEKIKSGDLVDMDAVIKGSNIAYIYIFVGYYDEESNSILIADKDFIEADGTKVIDGIYYPDWSDKSKIEMEFEWDSILFSLTDGKDDLFCLLEPANYGKTADDAVYYVEGIYSTADGKDSRYAQIYMNADGQIIIIYGFTGKESGGAPHEIKPKKGDSFTILETWIEIDDKGNTSNIQEQGGILTFGKDPVEWYDFDAYPGGYIIGFIVEDFDGNLFEQYTNLEVVE